MPTYDPLLTEESTIITENILPLSIVLGLICYSLIARFYLMPWLSSKTKEQALIPLLFLHSFRYIGLAFLIPGVTSVPLDPRFSSLAAYGDLAAALLAILSIIGLRMKWVFAIHIVWIFNIVGTVDLLNAIYKGYRYVPDGDFGASYFIPAIIVPALLVTHYILFVLLLRKK